VFSFTAMSNVLGTVTPTKLLIEAAHAAGAVAFVDICQYAPHYQIDVAALDADAVAFSAHKLFGPTGLGVLWAKESLLNDMPPFLGGGNMIDDVSFDGFRPAPLPAKFEAGTQPVVEIVGFGAALRYLRALDRDGAVAHEDALTALLLERLSTEFPDTLTIHGPTTVGNRGGVVSFTLHDVHPHDASQVLNETNVCVRAGHHCAKPLLKKLGVGATTRASVSFYNTAADIDALIVGLHRARSIFAI
jgi:cysteine desulfurase / selenocysteine lyase